LEARSVTDYILCDDGKN